MSAKQAHIILRNSNIHGLLHKLNHILGSGT